MASTSGHTCTSCAVLFRDTELQRDHYKTDWHRYNLKRKVAELAPVTLEVFREKMEQHHEKMMVSEDADQDLTHLRNSMYLNTVYCMYVLQVLSGEVKEPTGYCVCCRKSFNNQRAYDNHVNSKKHKQIAQKFEEKSNKVNKLRSVYYVLDTLCNIDFSQMEIANNRLNRKPSESTSDVMEEDEEIEELDSDEWEEMNEDGEAVPSTDCIFCSHHSK